jgi:hypothetical protein
MANTTTYTLGYFNKNDYAINVALSSHNYNVILTEKNQFLRDINGNMINDPVLEKYVTPNGLAKKISPVPVPINYINKPLQHTPSVTGFTGVSNPKANEKTVQSIYAKEQKNAVNTTPDVKFPVGHHILAMTADEAKRRGLIKPTRQVHEGIPDGEERSARQLPELELPVDSPQGKFQQGSDKLVKTEVKDPNYVQQLVGNNPDILKRLNMLPKDVSVPVDDLDLPEPVLEDDTTVVDALLEAPKEPKHFVCQIDNKMFTSKTKLLNHVKKNWPDQLEVITAQFEK